MASPYTLTIQYIVLFSHLTVQLPRVMINNNNNNVLINSNTFILVDYIKTTKLL